LGKFEFADSAEMKFPKTPYYGRFALKLAHRDSSVFQRDTVWHGLKRLLKKPLCGA
jgi:hypothetical protein